MCRVNGKRYDIYRKSKSNTEFIDGIKVHTPNGGSKYEPVELTVEGNTIFKGTWVHYKIALHLGIWISPEFGNWAMETLMNVINGDFQALTKEAAEAQAQLNKAWDKIRAAGKVTRRKLTDAIRDWYIRNPNGTSRPQHAMYA